MENELKQIQGVFPEAKIVKDTTIVLERFYIWRHGTIYKLSTDYHAKQMVCESKLFSEILVVLETIKKVEI